MDKRNAIEKILSEMIKSIKIYQIDTKNSIFDVDYELFLNKIMTVVDSQNIDLNDQ